MALDIDLDYSIREVRNKKLKFDILPPKKEFTVTEARDFFRNIIISVADEILTEELALGFPEDYITLVDRKLNKPIGQVNAGGQIEFSARQSIEEIAFAMWDEVIKLSKVVTGQYIDSHRMYFNGKEVARSREQIKLFVETAKITAGSKLRMINTQPYARRLETLGVTAQSSTVRRGRASKRAARGNRVTIRKPNGAYFVGKQRLNKLFGSQAYNFKYKLVSGFQIPGLDSGRKNVFTNQRRGNDRPYVYPSIFVELQPETIQAGAPRLLQ